jgi:hypothetical protein
MKEGLLELIEPEGWRVYWKFTLNETEYLALIEEVKSYQAWIGLLLTGKAHPAAYVDQEQREILYAVSNSKLYASILPESLTNATRGYYEITPTTYLLDLYDLNAEDDESLEIKEQYLTNELKILTNKELVNLLTNPFDLNDTFSLGYMLLPVTKKLVST